MLFLFACFFLLQLSAKLPVLRICAKFLWLAHLCASYFLCLPYLAKFTLFGLIDNAPLIYFEPVDGGEIRTRPGGVSALWAIVTPGATSSTSHVIVFQNYFCVEQFSRERWSVARAGVLLEVREHSNAQALPLCSHHRRYDRANE